MRRGTEKNAKATSFVQEFEFVPAKGPYYGKLDEVEVIVQSLGNGQYELLLEIDRKARGFSGFLSEVLDADESLVRVTVSESEIAQLSATLERVISRYSV